MFFNKVSNMLYILVIYQLSGLDEFI